MKDTIHRIHCAEEELHNVHNLCLQAEKLYHDAQKVSCPDLSFFVSTESSQEESSAKRRSNKQVSIPGKYLPPCEYQLMCLLQKEAKESGHYFALPTWCGYEEEIVKGLLNAYEEGKEREFVQEQEVTKRMHMSEKLAKLYPHIQHLASLIHRIQMLEEQKSTLFASMNKMIYATARVKLNTEELKKNMISARDMIMVFGLGDEIKKRFEFLKRCVTH